jgi:hypothetical protein
MLAAMTLNPGTGESALGYVRIVGACRRSAYRYPRPSGMRPRS